MLNFLFEVGHEVRVYRNSVTISFRIFWWKLPLAKMCCLRGKTRDKYVFAVRCSLLSLYKVVEPCRYIYIEYKSWNKQTNKSNVERGNFVCQIAVHKQYRSCPLPGHSSAMTPLLYQQGFFKSSTKWGKACFCIDPEHDGAPVAGETLIKYSPPWTNIKSQVRGIQVGTVIAILKTCNICLN